MSNGVIMPSAAEIRNPEHKSCSIYSILSIVSKIHFSFFPHDMIVPQNLAPSWRLYSSSSLQLVDAKVTISGDWGLSRGYFNTRRTVISAYMNKFCLVHRFPPLPKVTCRHANGSASVMQIIEFLLQKVVKQHD